MKTGTKKADSTAAKTQPSPKNEGVTKGNGTKASAQPQGGRNPNGKDGAKEAVPLNKYNFSLL